MICARRVFRCFKALERAGDALTGAAGPLFVFLAIVLLSLGTFCFFEVILPSLMWPWLSGPICVLIAVNLFVHYYWLASCGHDGGAQRATEPPPACTGRRMFISPKPRCPSADDAESCDLREHIIVEYATAVFSNTIITVHHSTATGINQCVGLHNERHFMLFLIYLSISTLCYTVLGWPFVFEALGWDDLRWTHRSPEIAFMLAYILAFVMFFAVSIMAGYHFFSITSAETSVESQDHEQYQKIAKGRGEKFVNSYDLGRLRNLELFFNIGKDGYPTYTLFFPLRIEPYTDGRSWARRPGADRHLGIRAGEELTDEDDD